MNEKKSLKGFCGARLWPILQNDAQRYETGEMIPLSGAQSLSKDIKRSEYTVYADDGIFDSGSDYQYEDLTLTLAQLPLQIEAALSGGEYAGEEYNFKNTDAAPEFALGYAALLLSGQYRMYKHYALKLISIKADHSTRGDKNDVQPYKLTMRSTQRMADGMVRTTRDSSDREYSWLDTMETLP